MYVEGRLQTRRFTGQDGNEREITEVVIDSMIALGQPKGKSEYDEGGYEDYGSYGPGPTGDASGSQSDASGIQDETASGGVMGDDTVSAPATKPAAKKTTSKVEESATEEVDADDIPF